MSLFEIKKAGNIEARLSDLTNLII